MALSGKYRIKNKKEIDRVFKGGRTVKGSFLFIRFVVGSRAHSRFALIVPSKYISLAADRNRIKRILSEEITRIPGLLEKKFDIVASVSRKIIRSEFKELPEELRELISRI